jgi:hypothetical protein
LRAKQETPGSEFKVTLGGNLPQETHTVLHRTRFPGRDSCVINSNTVTAVLDLCLRKKGFLFFYFLFILYFFIILFLYYSIILYYFYFIIYIFNFYIIFIVLFLYYCIILYYFYFIILYIFNF